MTIYKKVSKMGHKKLVVIPKRSDIEIGDYVAISNMDQKDAIELLEKIADRAHKEKTAEQARRLQDSIQKGEVDFDD